MYLESKCESEHMPSIVKSENMCIMTMAMSLRNNINENKHRKTNVMLSCITRYRTSGKSISLNSQYAKDTVYHGQNGGT